MENCLVTKLKGIVTNDNLPKLGCLTLSIAVNNAFPSNLITTESGYLNVEILSDGVAFDTASGSSQVIDSRHAKIRTVYGNNVTLTGVPTNGIVKFSIGQKYDFINFLSISQNIGRNTTLDLGDFKYMTNLKKLGFTKATGSEFDIKGSISSLSNLTSLTSIRLNYVNVTGDIKTIGNLTGLTELALAQKSNNVGFITGNWEEFVSMQKANGRVSCSDFGVIGMSRYSKIEFGSAGIPRAADSENATLSWDSDKIAFTYTTSKKVYVIGYSAEEIASLEGEGYTVIVSD